MAIKRPTYLAAALMLIASEAATMGQTITIGSNGTNTTDTNIYSGAVSLVKVGSNIVSLTGSNSYTGATTVSNGVLQAGANGAFSTNSTFTLNGGTIDLNATTQSIHMVQMLSGTNTQINGSLTTLRPFFEAIMLAPNAGDFGTYNLQGGYLGTTNLGNIQVGYRGTGVFNQSGGTNNISGYFVIGRFNLGGNGTYNLTGGLALQSSSNRVSLIGEDGAGVMNVSGTGVYSNAGKIIIASTANANGTLSISNGGVVIAPGIDFGAGKGGVVFDRSDVYTNSIPMNGQGSVTKNGSGTVTFAVNNGYTRGTMVNQGALIVKGLANNANNTVTVNTNGTFVFAVNNTFGNHSANVITPIVINSGGLVTNGGNFVNALGPITMNGGTLVATAVHDSGYSYLLKGDVTVNSNSTISGPGITLGSAAITGTAFNVSGGATLTVDSGFTNGPSPTWPRSQASYLTKVGGGTMLLNGTNTYTGDTTISNGVLWVDGSGVLNNGNYDGNISIATNGRLVIGTTANQSLGGIISGLGSLVKTNSGTLTITGPDNSYNGTTTIGAGTLVLNGTHIGGGGYTVQTNATLMGEGRTTSAVTVESGGNITPGNGGLGELTIGSLTLNGTLNIFLDVNNTSLLTVIGNASLSGGSVNFITNNALTNDVYVFLSASGELSGTFASSNTPSGYGLVYDTNDGVAFLKKSSVTNVVEAIFNGPNAVIGNGTTNFSVYVYNGSSNTTITNFTATGTNYTSGSVSTNNIAPTNGVELPSLTYSYTGTNFGTNTGAFNYTLNGASNQATFDVVVYDHASNVVTGTNLSFGAVHRGAATASSTNSVTVSNSSTGFRIALGVTNNNTNSYLSIDTAGGLAQGDSADLFGQLDPSKVALGYFTNTVQLISYDDSDLSGASTNVGTTSVTITGYVYSGQGVWTSTNGGDWSDFAKWQVDGGTPGLDGALSVADTATFGTNGSGSVTLDTNASLLSVTFSNAASSYTVGGTNTLTLASYGGTNASVSTLTGSHTITAPVEFASAVILSNSIGTGLTISGSITGNGSLVKSGAGTTTLTGSNGYVGTTTITGGTLEVKKGALGSGAVTVSGGVLSPIGPDSLNIATDLTFGASGAYLWTLYANTNSGPGTNFTAPTQVGGKLSVATNAQFEMFFTTNVHATNDFWDANDNLTNSWVVMTGSDLAEGVNFRASFAPGSMTDGFDPNNFFFTVSGGNLLLNFTPGLIVFPGPDEFRPGNNNYPWVVYQPGGELDIPVGVNVIIKAAVTMNNNSTTIVNGQFTSTNGFTLANGSLLGGSGTLNGNLVSSGTVSPGNSPGTLTVNGNYTQTSAGAILFQAASLSSFDRIVVTGTASLAGALNAVGYGGYALAPGTSFQFLTATGGITGTFDTITLDNPTLRGRFLVSGANNSLGTLLIAPLTYSQMATTPNDASVAKALDTFITATSGDKLTVSTALDSLTASQYSQAFAAIAPTLYQSLSTMAFNAANAQYNDLVQQMFGLRVAGTGFTMSGLGDNIAILEGQGDKGVLDSKKDILRPGEDNHWGMFVDGNGIFAQANSGNMLQNFNAQSGGLIAGLTYKWSPAVATGIYSGYQGTYAKYSGTYSGSTVINNAVRFGLLATYGDPSGRGLYGDALIGGSYNNYSVTRAITFPGMNRTANSTPGAGELDSMIAAGYNFRKGNWAFGPVSSLQYTYFGMNSFNETGAQSLDYQGLNWNTASMIYNLGANCAYNWKASRNLTVVPQVNLAWQHEFMQNPYSINGNLSGTPVVNTSSAPLRDTLYTGVGVTLEYKKRWNTAFFYNAAAGNSDLVSQNIFWSLGCKF